MVVKTSRQIAKSCAQFAEEKKAEDIIVLDLKKRKAFADYMIICSGNSDVHLKAIMDYIYIKLKQEKIYPLHIEGEFARQWLLIDYGAVVVNIFLATFRDFYKLEHLWGNCKQIDWKENASQKNKKNNSK